MLSVSIGGDSLDSEAWGGRHGSSRIVVPGFVDLHGGGSEGESREESDGDGLHFEGDIGGWIGNDLLSWKT